jgi:hypothetical protein
MSGTAATPSVPLESKKGELDMVGYILQRAHG